MRRYATRGVLLAVTGVSLYLLFPSLVEVFSSWRSLSRVAPAWAALALAAEAASFAAIWELQRLALGARGWFAVAASQLAGTAFSRIVPGGLAAAGGLQVGMLRRAGLGGGRSAAALTAASALLVATLLALPLLALPAIVAGAPVDRSLAASAYLGAGVLAVIVAGGVAAFAFDRPLVVVGRAAERVRRGDGDLARRLLEERDFIRGALGGRLARVLAAATARSALDYLALLCALRAVGATPRPSLVLLAYVASQVLSMIPVTPGGLGFVEAGLVGTLALAGVSAGDAVVATLAYRLVSFWLPIPVGFGAWWLFRRRYRIAAASPPATK